MSTLLVRFACASVLVAAAVGAETVPVTTCHQHIVGGTAELAVDLDCSAIPLAVGVDLLRGKLHLNGHSISGAEIGVGCSERCTIYGPGTITGNTTGVMVLASRPSTAKATITDATVSGNTALGIGADKVKLTRSTISGNGGLTIGGHVVGGGVFATVTATARDSVIDDNLTYGMCSPGRIRIGNTTVQGNGDDPGCDPEPACGACGDLVSSARPKVSSRSACDTSVDPPSATWGVCSGDAAP